jgi:hypothetical protein
VVPKPDGFALDQEGETGVDGADSGTLVVAEQAFLLLHIRGRVEPPAELPRVGEGGLESLAGAAEGRRLLLRDLGGDPPVGILEPSHRKRATASA